MRQNSARRIANGFQVHRDRGHQVNRQHWPGFLDGRSRRSPARLVARLPYNYDRFCIV